MHGAHDPSGPVPQCSNDRNASMAGRNRESRRFALELRPGIGCNAHERRSEQPRLQAPKLVVAQPFFFERHAERLGQREHLVIIAAVRSEQSPDPHFLARLVVHSDGGH